MFEDLLTRPGDPSTLPALLRQAVAARPDAVAIVAAGETITYRALLQRSSALARSLLARGCGKGTRVGVLFPNGADWVVAFDAVTRIGAIAVPVNTFSTARELGWLLRHADIDTLLMGARHRNHDYVARLEEVAPELAHGTSPDVFLPTLPYLRRVVAWGADPLPAWCLDGDEIVDHGDGIDEAFLVSVEAEVVPADLAAVIYTSGTTSTPKGVVHTQGTIVRKSLQIMRGLELVATDRYYTNMPFFWVGGLLLGVLACRHAGCALHCTATNDIDELLSILRREEITRMTLFSPPATVLKEHPSYRDDDFTELRELTTASPRGGLGMTETFGMHSVTLPWLPPGPPGGMGIGIPGVTRKIVDPETGSGQPIGVTGELWVRGPFLMDGYYKRERADVFEEDGFFRTGDQCRIDEEGWIFWEGRLDEAIKTAGANVAPAEVEMVLLSLPEVSVAAVLGLPDRDRGTRVVAVVEMVESAEVDLQDLTARLRTQLASYKVPTEIIVMDKGDIPLSPVGKVLKPQLRELLEQAGTR